MSVRVASRPTPSAYPSLVFSSSFGSRVISASVSASTPDSERSYATLCSQTDCMRSMSKRGNFMGSAGLWTAARLVEEPGSTQIRHQSGDSTSRRFQGSLRWSPCASRRGSQELRCLERVLGPPDQVVAAADGDLGVLARRSFVLIFDRVLLCEQEPKLFGRFGEFARVRADLLEKI